jgi:hypothetical protein
MQINAELATVIASNGLETILGIAGIASEEYLVVGTIAGD